MGVNCLTTTVPQTNINNQISLAQDQTFIQSFDTLQLICCKQNCLKQKQEVKSRRFDDKATQQKGTLNLAGQTGDKWSEKLMGFEHNSTISAYDTEKDLVKLGQMSQNQNLSSNKEQSKNCLTDEDQNNVQKQEVDDLSSNFFESNYYENNSEIVYVENQVLLTKDGQGHKIKKKKDNQINQVRELHYVSNIEQLYKISFKYKDILGNGAFGTVRTCCLQKSEQIRNLGSQSLAGTTQVKEEMKFAIKTMDKEVIDKSTTYKQLLQNELEILRELNHPKIMRVFDLIEDDKNYYVVSELIMGGSVMSRLRAQGHPFTEIQTLIIVRQVLQAMKYLHSLNIAHRDFKLENLLFTSENLKNLNVKLIDFGFASKFEKNKGMNLILGSPLYMAPELVKRQAGYTEKVDIWALGVVTYLLLTGCTPFQSNTIQKIHQNALIKNIQFTDQVWQHISQEAIDFIKLCLNRDRKTRVSSAQLLDTHPWMKMFTSEIKTKYKLGILQQNQTNSNQLQQSPFDKEQNN